MDLNLQGKTALVAGAGRDIGRATALALAREGSKVVLSGRKRDALDETAALITEIGGSAHVVAGDLGEPQYVEELVQEALAFGGRIDLLASTAGPFPLKALDPSGPGPMYGDDDSWREAFEGVLMTAVRLVREVLPLMKAQGSGAVVLLGANSARYYNPMTAQFAAMKSALVHIIKNWARDSCKNGVRVNAVLPGWVRSAHTVRRLEQEATDCSVEELEARNVTGHDNLYWTPRMGRPEEYADAVVFLLSERASYINGALLPVDGGSPVW